MTTDARAEALTDEQIDVLLNELDAYAVEYDRYEYGLPCWGNPMLSNMRAIVRNSALLRSASAEIARLKAIASAQAASAEPVAPIDMVLHCPACGMQHIDAPEKFQPVAEGCHCQGPDRCESCYYNEEAWRDWKASGPWTNPSHRSHLCHGCGHIWRPADVPTNGVAAVTTKGKADSPITTPAAKPAAVTDEMVSAYLEANEAYWAKTDAMPTPPDKWRTGTAREATRVSLAAALATRTPEPQAERAGPDWRAILKRAREGVAAGSRSLSDMETEQCIAFPLLDHIFEQFDAAEAASPAPEQAQEVDATVERLIKLARLCETHAISMAAAPQPTEWRKHCNDQLLNARGNLREALRAALARRAAQ